MEWEFANECQNLSVKLTAFVDDFLDKNKGDLKNRIKSYENYRGEYDKCYQKVEKNRAKRNIVRLYESEKERAKSWLDYNKSVLELEAHCDDIDDLLATRLLEDFINFYNAQKNMLGLSYGQLDDIKGYLSNLKEWCIQERKTYEEHKRERDIQRDKLQKSEIAITISQFVSMFNNSPELFDVIGTLARHQNSEASIIPAFKSLFIETEITMSDALKEHLKNYNTKEEGSPTKQALETTRIFIRDHIDEIGTRILEEHKNKDILINLGGLLSSLEQLQIGK